MTAEQIKRLHELAEKMPEPWRFTPDVGGTDMHGFPAKATLWMTESSGRYGFTTEQAELIVAAHNALPALLAAHAERDRLREDNARMRQWLQQTASGCWSPRTTMTDLGGHLGEESCGDCTGCEIEDFLAARAALVEQEATP